MNDHGKDVDAQFEDIIAHWDDPVVGSRSPVPPEPDTSGEPPAGTGSTPDRGVAGPRRPDRHLDEPDPPDPSSPPNLFPPNLFPPNPSPLNLSPPSPTPAAPEGRPGLPPPTFDRWRPDAVDGLDVEEHFEPPPPRPLPAGDLQFWGILLGLVGGPLLLLYLVLFDRHAGSLWLAAALGLSVGGFALLVNRLPSRRDDNDDGAQV